MSIIDYIRRNRFADLLLFSVIVLALLALIRFLPDPPALSLEGRARVIDGDSLVVQGTEIRLLGIDAPEYAQNCEKGGKTWACGAESARRLRTFLGGVKLACTGNRYDQHERLLAICKRGDTEINSWMVEQGWAVSFDRYPGKERAARKASRGLWASKFTRPSQWRKYNGN